MILYLLLILFLEIAITTAVSLIRGANFFLVLAITGVSIIAVIAINGLTATVCRLLPKGCANHERKFYQVSAKEKKFYEKLKIRKWKDKVPEIGQFTGFRKNKIEDPSSVEFVDRFLLETCYGEMGHFLSLFTSFLLLLFFPLFPVRGLWWAIGIPVSVFGSLFNLPSFMILRYNSYKLRVLRKSALKKSRRKAKEQADVAEITA